VEVSKHGIVFFDAGRGIGLTGSSVVIVRKDLVGFDLPTCPDMMSFQKTVTANSIINTPYTLSTLLLAEYIDYCNKNGKTLNNIEINIRKIK
jgi:phosphoserine aminotransferase